MGGEGGLTFTHALWHVCIHTHTHKQVFTFLNQNFEGFHWLLAQAPCAVPVYTHVHMYAGHIYVYMSMHMCAHGYGDPKWVTFVFLGHSPPYIWRQGL